MYRASLAITVLYLLKRDNRSSVFLIHLGSILLLATSCPNNCQISQEVLLGSYMHPKWLQYDYPGGLFSLSESKSY